MPLDDDGHSRVFRASGELPNENNDKRFTSQRDKTANGDGTDCGTVKQRRPRKIDLLDVDRLREVLDYNPNTGGFTWRVKTGPRGRVGARAGNAMATGYRVISIDGIQYLSHRLAWLHFYGEHPPAFLDHKNMLKDDNRIANLRAATKSENAQNRLPRPGRLKGVAWVTKNAKWRATIRVHNKRIWLGMFTTAEEAHAAYRAKAAELHGNFMRIKMNSIETRKQLRSWAADKSPEIQNRVAVLCAQLRTLDQHTSPALRKVVSASMARVQDAAA